MTKRSGKSTKTKTYFVTLTAYVEVETTIEIIAESEKEAGIFAEGYMEDNMGVDIGSNCGDISHSVTEFKIHQIEVEE